ncbi:MAG TPA: hypothetical protein VN876_06680 [Gemmatimonadaceae bacterium]|nr:hypothetical protein [Gemmatimonadaceae bacterium]
MQDAKVGEPENGRWRDMLNDWRLDPCWILVHVQNRRPSSMRAVLGTFWRWIMRILFLRSLVATLVLSCAPPSATVGRHDSNVITSEEIASAHVNNAFDAVSILRPSFLRYRGVTSLERDTSCTVDASGRSNCKPPIAALGGDTGYARVYLNHQFYGNITSLRGIDANSIREIHYYNVQQASNRFGLGNPSGVIEVVTGASP